MNTIFIVNGICFLILRSGGAVYSAHNNDYNLINVHREVSHRTIIVSGTFGTQDFGSNKFGIHEFEYTGKDLIPPVRISYVRDMERLKMIIHLKNKPPKAYGLLSVISNDEKWNNKSTLTFLEAYLKIDSQLMCNMIAVDLELCRNDACLKTIRIVEGKATGWDSSSKRGGICTQEFCGVVVDVEKELNGTHFLKSVVEGGNSTSSTVTSSTVTNCTITNSTATNSTITDSTTTNSTITSSTFTIVSSLFGAAFVLLVIMIGIWKCYARKHIPQDSPVLPKIPVTDPFYLNLLFRKECDHEIAEIEAHVYEEVGAHQYDQVENRNESLQPNKLVTDRVAASATSGILPVPDGLSAPKMLTCPLRDRTPQSEVLDK